MALLTVRLMEMVGDSASVFVSEKKALEFCFTTKGNSTRILSFTLEVSVLVSVLPLVSNSGPELRKKNLTSCWQFLYRCEKKKKP